MIRNRDKARRPGARTCDATGRRTAAGGRAGFTLAELLISIGILGVGLTMSAALFPAGLAANKNSANDLIGTLICGNALTLGQAQLTRTAVTGTAYVDCSSAFTTEHRQYPMDSGNETGFFIIARQLQANRNDYQVMAIAYRRHPDGGTVSLKTATGTAGTTGDVGTFAFSNAADAQVGSPVILRDAGANGYARIVSMDGNTATLDHPLSGSGSVYLVHQQNMPASPAMAAMAIRTPLRD